MSYNRAQVLFEYLDNEVANHDGFSYGEPDESTRVYEAHLCVPSEDENEPDRTFRVVIEEVGGEPARETRIAQAIEHLRSARVLLADAKAPKALGRVRLALTSAAGALRHAHLDAVRAERQAKAVKP